MNPESINKSAPSVSNEVEISIGGEKFLLNVERAKELGLLKEKKVIKIGQRYRESSGDEYILCTFGYRNIALINLTSGGHWANPVVVNDLQNLSKEEFENVKKWGEFTLIS